VPAVAADVAASRTTDDDDEVPEFRSGPPWLGIGIGLAVVGGLIVMAFSAAKPLVPPRVASAPVVEAPLPAPAPPAVAAPPPVVDPAPPPPTVSASSSQAPPRPRKKR
jgi:hypothetical protein